MDNSTSTPPGSNKHAVFLPSLTNLLHHRGNFLLTAIFVIDSHSLTPRPRMTTRSIPNHSPVWSNASPESNLQRHLAVKLHNTPKLSTNSWYLPQISRQLKPPNCFNFCFVYSIFLLVVRHRFYPDRVPYKNSEFSILLRRRDQHFFPKWSSRNWSPGNGDIFWVTTFSFRHYILSTPLGGPVHWFPFITSFWLANSSLFRSLSTFTSHGHFHLLWRRRLSI